FFEGLGGQVVGLPTYAFQHRSFWPKLSPGRSGDVAAIGQAGADHPLLGAVVVRADGDGVLFTGRLSRQTHPWLADHTVLDTVLLPGTAFVELAIRAGDQLSCGRIVELTLETPLILPERSGLAVQLTVDAEDESGHRSLKLYSRPDADTGEETWTRNASGVLATGGGDEPDWADFTEWPPAGASEIP